MHMLKSVAMLLLSSVLETKVLVLDVLSTEYKSCHCSES